MRQAKIKFLTFTTYEDEDPRCFTRMEWFKKTKDLPRHADLDEAVHLLFDEGLVDWVWHWAYSREEAIRNHQSALDAL